MRGRYVTPDLSYYWEGAREWFGDNKLDEKEKIVAKVYHYYYQL